MNSAAPTHHLLLNNNEKRLLRLLTYPATLPNYRQRFSSNPTISQLHERLIDAHNAFDEYERLTIIHNSIFELGEHEDPQDVFPQILHHFMEAVKERRLKIRDNILRQLLYTHQIVSFASDLLGRGPNANSTIRSQNICQNCGYGGHWPTECPDWRCATCQTWGPGHTAENCPHYLPPSRRSLRRMRPLPTRRSTPRPAPARPVPPPPQRQPLADRVPPALAPISDSDSEQENRMVLPTEPFYNSTASDTIPSTHPSTLDRPRIVIETTTAEPSPQPHFSPLQAAPSGSQLTVYRAIEVDPILRDGMGLEPGEQLELDEFGRPSEAMRQRYLASVGHIPTPTPAEMEQIMQDFQSLQDTSAGP